MDFTTERSQNPPVTMSFFYPIPVALSLLILRILLEKFYFEPIGIKLGLEAPIIHPIKNRKGTLSFLKWLPHISINSKVYYLSTLQNFLENFGIESSPKPSKLSKFSKSIWQLIFFTFTFITGMIILWNKSWFWILKECWVGYPHQNLTDDVWVYNFMNIAFYWSLLITLLVGTKKKDFNENAIHHSVAILLIYLSVNCQCFRIGTIIIVDLSVSDVFLEASKIANYLEYNKTCTACFILFTIIWIISRWVVFPFWIIHNTLFHVPKVLPINLKWVIKRGLTEGDIRDVRSDSENDN
ncbi:ceramide synthase 5-like [Diorhabda sublineata]|uniref:ceramide synthase 5-like n=1 Tax=Diorhabda sublineata TaxID=1163346 RepID=UPI0024E12105|nr:ceramide synthase 5-like [Diorhabda sublineata]